MIENLPMAGSTGSCCRTSAAASGILRLDRSQALLWSAYRCSKHRKLRDARNDALGPASNDQPRTCANRRRAFAVIDQQILRTLAAIEDGRPLVLFGLQFDAIAERAGIDAAMSVQANVAPDEAHGMNDGGCVELARERRL